VINVIRAHLAEFGIVAPVGRKGVEELQKSSRAPALGSVLDVNADPSDKRVPAIARACLAALGIQLRRLSRRMFDATRAEAFYAMWANGTLRHSPRRTVLIASGAHGII
jgi:transposase